MMNEQFGMGHMHGHCCHCHGCGMGYEEIDPEKKKRMLSDYRIMLERKLEMIKEKEAMLSQNT